MTPPAPGYYAIIPATVRYDDKLTGNAKLLYGEISALCNKEGYCWATNAYFSQLYKVKPRAIQDWIGQLVSSGHIDIAQETGKQRQIFIKGDVKNHMGGVKIHTPPGENSPENASPSIDRILHTNTTEAGKERGSIANEFLKWYGKEYEQRRMTKYLCAWKKDNELVKKLLVAFSLEEIQKRALRYLDMDDKYLENVGYTIGIFFVRFNGLADKEPKKAAVTIKTVKTCNNHNPPHKWDVEKEKTSMCPICFPETIGK